MEKKQYVKPLVEVVKLGTMQLICISGEGVQSTDGYDIGFGGIDEDGTVTPQ